MPFSKKKHKQHSNNKRTPGYWTQTEHGPRPKHKRNPAGTKLVRKIAKRVG